MKLEKALGANIISPKEEIVTSLKEKKENLSKTVGLTFEKHSDLVVGYVNPKQYTEYFLSLPGTQLALQTPKVTLVIFAYTDLAPFLKWSRNFTGLTSLRVKPVEPYNLQSSVLSVAYYLGDDSYENTRKCFHAVYSKLAVTNVAYHFLKETTVELHYRCVGDGKERRSGTGNSTACSTYPICDAPEHSSLLGDMKVISGEPVWTVDNSSDMGSRFKEWLGKWKDNK